MSSDPNRSRPTIRTVAALAGVSTATVSYVLRGKPGIPADTAERVRGAARQVGYRPNRAAQAMRTGRNQIVLMSLLMLADPWSLAVCDAVSSRSRALRMSPLIQADGDWAEAIGRIDPDVAYVDTPEALSGYRELLGRLVDRGQRLVVFSETMEPDGFEIIRSRARPGAQLMVDHLQELTDDVVCLASQGSLAESEAPTSRYRPYLDAVAAGRLRPRPAALFDGTPTDAFQAAVRTLQSANPPRALFCLTDFVAVAAIQAAQSLGMVVGEEVLITGLGNSPQAQQTTPTLTTAGPVDFFDRQAEIILAAADQPPGKPGEGSVHDFEWQLLPGASTDPGAGP